MAWWVPTAFGALHLRDHEFAEQGFDLMLVPSVPSDPLFLYGAGAALWLDLLAGPLDDGDLTDHSLDVLRELARKGLASTLLDHGARVREIQGPWLSSTFHELVYALVANVAKSLDIQIVFIKGPTLRAQGLRKRDHSGDVDCWVFPGDEIRLADAMRAWGWAPLTTTFTGTYLAHSLTLIAERWGCEIDIHTRFPGVTVGPEIAFDLVNSRSELRMFAGVECRTPALVEHAILLALHEVRPVPGSGLSSFKLESAVTALRVAGSETVSVTSDLGAGHALQIPLKNAFPKLELNFAGSHLPPEWKWRLNTSTTLGLVTALRSLPAGQRMRVLRRLLVPSREALAASGQLPETRWALWRVYFGRIVRALRKLPKGSHRTL